MYGRGNEGETGTRRTQGNSNQRKDNSFNNNCLSVLLQILFYRNRRMEVMARRRVAMVIPSLVHQLTQLNAVEFGSFRELPNFYYACA